MKLVVWSSDSQSFGARIVFPLASNLLAIDTPVSTLPNFGPVIHSLPTTNDEHIAQHTQPWPAHLTFRLSTSP